MAFKPYFELDISKKYDEDERRAIALEVIDFIFQRTKDGKDKNNESFPKYSDEYKKLKGQSNVDLELTGEMLTEIEILRNQPGKIRIGYSGDIVGKVEGNVLGTYGQEKPIKGKQRDFLEISENDLKKITKNYPVNNEEKRRERINDLAAGEIISQSLLDALSFEFET